MELQSKINKHAGKRFFTNSGIEVTELIHQERTKIFTDYTAAQLFARDKRSYTYDVRVSESKNKHRKKTFYGYAVPC